MEEDTFAYLFNKVLIIFMDFSYHRTFFSCLQMLEMLIPMTNLHLLLMKSCNHLIYLILLAITTLFNTRVVLKLYQVVDSVEKGLEVK